VAREIIEEPDEPRWNHMKHYFMDNDTKERAKMLLHFNTVPFYIVSNDMNQVIHTGTKCIDLALLPGRIQLKPKTILDCEDPINQSAAKVVMRSSSPSRVFEIEDLDF
jgi:hypothetical protein